MDIPGLNENISRFPCEVNKGRYNRISSSVRNDGNSSAFISNCMEKYSDDSKYSSIQNTQGWLQDIFKAPFHFVFSFCFSRKTSLLNKDEDGRTKVGCNVLIWKADINVF